jgi:hypothetical protein
MSHKFTFGCILILQCCAASAQTYTHLPGVGMHNAKLTGKVLDAVERTPLVGALVTIENPTGGEPRVVISEQDGSYEVSGLVSKRQYRVTFSKEEYAPDERLVTVSATQDGTLLKQHADAAYWKMTADIMTARIRADGQTENNEAFARTWEELRNSTISADGKAIVASHLKRDLPSRLWSESSTFNAYASADPSELKTIEKALSLHSNSPDTFAVDPMILQDIRRASKKTQVTPQTMRDVKIEKDTSFEAVATDTTKTPSKKMQANPQMRTMRTDTTDTPKTAAPASSERLEGALGGAASGKADKK